MGLLDFAQAASNAAASNVSGPVDLLALALRKAGLPIPDDPVLGSEWMRRRGLTKDVPQSASSLAGETAGLLAPIAAVAKAPQIARGLLAMGENAAAPRASGMAASQRGGVDVGAQAVDSAAEREARMQAMGLERGWYRGGQKPDASGRRTGPWYTRDTDEAANYAKRFGDNGDVREYAIPSSGFFRADNSYSSKLPHDVAKLLDDAYYGKQGAQLAKELRTFGPDERINGSALWQALESRFGNDGAAEVLSKLGPFKGAKGITGGDEAYVFKTAPVRDAEKAKFRLADINLDNIYAGLMAASVGLPALFADRRQQD